MSECFLLIKKIGAYIYGYPNFQADLEWIYIDIYLIACYIFASN